MSRFFDYDPFTGIHETTEIDETSGLVTIHQEEDVEPLVDQCKEMANCGLTDRGIKRNFWHYAEIPITQVLELRRRGIDIFDRNCTKAMFREINQNMPYLKVTHKTHA